MTVTPLRDEFKRAVERAYMARKLPEENTSLALWLADHALARWRASEEPRMYEARHYAKPTTTSTMRLQSFMATPNTLLLEIAKLPVSKDYACVTVTCDDGTWLTFTRKEIERLHKGEGP